MPKRIASAFCATLAFSAIPWRWIITFAIAILTLILKYLPDRNKKP